MRACPNCDQPVVEVEFRRLGRHAECPRGQGREAYLAWKRRRMPRLVALQERLRGGGSLRDAMMEDREAGRDTDAD